MVLHKFRVIVVGGGPVGLMAAHVLSSAGIDFVVLEKHETVAPELGNGTATWPQTNRVLDQLRLLEHLKPLATPIHDRTILTHDGTVYYRNKSFRLTQANHGGDCDMYHRHDLLRAFCDHLPDSAKAKILVNKNVTSIESNNWFVRVHCKDGTVEQGDIVIGADGVHSITRQLMRELALQSSPPASAHEVNDEKPWLATYRVLYGSLLNTPDLGLNQTDFYESHGRGICTQFVVGRERMWFFLYSKLPAPTQERAHYTQKDADEFAETVGDLHLTDNLSFRDLYERKIASGMANLEEGVMRHWSWGRIVLAGDSAHKMTPNLGLGFNSGVHDLVVLVNRLRALLQSQDADTPIATPVLGALFAAYQSERMRHVRRTTLNSGKMTRLGSWRTGWKHMLDVHIFPFFDTDKLLVTFAVGSQIRTVPALDWLDERHFAKGRIPWKHLPLEGNELPGVPRLKRSLGWDFIEAVLPSILALL